MCVIGQLLASDQDRENTIIRQVQDAISALVLPANQTSRIFEAAISLWYISSSGVFSRDPQQGLPPDADTETDENGIPFLRWSRSFSGSRHAVSNLGIIAMLMATQCWETPQSALLRGPTLISGAAVVILFATFLILPRITTVSMDYAISANNPKRSMAIFLRTAWAIGVKNRKTFRQPPGVEFGAHQGEIKLSPNGKSLLTKVGRYDWQEAAYWHPCKKTPGSPWNKFMRNFAQPIFSPSDSNTLWFHLPSSAHTLAEPFEAYYASLRLKMDRVLLIQTSWPTPNSC